MKTLITSTYPLYKVIAAVRQFFFNWQYHALVKRHGIALYDEPKEARLYRDILAGDLFRTLQAAHSWLNVPLYPTGGAADYKLLYLIGRALAEHPGASVIEFGAGQSTKLLDGYAQAFGARVVTVEHDAGWAERCRATAQHSIECLPLVPHVGSVGGFHWYDWPAEGFGKFDVMIVDGPVGRDKLSRIGFAEHFDQIAADEWLVLWDDLHFLRDMRSFSVFIEMLRKQRPDAQHRIVNGIKRIGIAATPKYSNALYYF